MQLTRPSQGSNQHRHEYHPNKLADGYVVMRYLSPLTFSLSAAISSVCGGGGDADPSAGSAVGVAATAGEEMGCSAMVTWLGKISNQLV